MANSASTQMASSTGAPAVLRARLDSRTVDPRLCFFSSPGDAVCGAYRDVAQRLANADANENGWIFIVVALEATRAQSVVAANIGSALALEWDVVLVDARDDEAGLFGVFGLNAESWMADVECVLVSDRLGLALHKHRSFATGGPLQSVVVPHAQSVADMTLIVANPDQVAGLRSGLEGQLSGLVVLVEQASLATGTLEAFVRETGAENVLGCLVVEDGRLRAE